MNTKIHSNSILVLALLAVASLSSLGAPHARAASIFDITFPIAELGGCADKDACKAYCAVADNQVACEQFAADHGIATAPKSTQNEKAKAVQEDGGPGKCAVGAKDPQTSCKAYCDSTSHIDECVSYGKSHGFLTGQQLVEAEKVQSALKRGAKLPLGCTNQSSCKAICENPQTIEQAKSCFAFGKAAGLLPDDFDEVRAEKVFQAIQDGSAPFKSPKDFQQCERPKDEATLKKCIEFAVQSGMMTQEQAMVVQRTGGKGPGGCVGENECRAYCDAHQQECFQFSKDNGLVSPEQEQQMKQGAVQFKQGLDRAPESVKSCLTSAIGQEALDAITSGTRMPDPSLGEKMRACFEQNRPDNFGQQDMGQPDENDQPRPAPEGQRQFRMPPQGVNASSSMRSFENRGNEQSNFQNRPSQPWPAIPAQVKDCLVQKYGDSVMQKMSQGPVQGELAGAVRECYSNSFGQDASRAREQEQRQQQMQQQPQGQNYGAPSGIQPVPTPGTTPPPAPAIEPSAPTSFINAVMHPAVFLANALAALLR